MIKSFSITNFKSISDKVALSFTETRRKKNLNDNYSEKTRIALSSVLYGANASGKSNILKAFAVLKYLIKESSKLKPNEPIRVYQPFKLNNKYLKLPTTLKIEFYIKNTLYIYEVSFDRKSIVKEKLDFYLSKRPANLFTREKNREFYFGEHFKGEKKLIETITLPNQLFLSKAAENNVECILPVFEYLNEHIVTYNLSEEISKSKVPDFLKSLSELFLINDFETIFSERLTEKYLAKKIHQDPNSSFIKKINTLIASLDTGIKEIASSKEEKGISNLLVPASDKKNDILKYTLKTIHKDNTNKDVEFSLDDESRGTRYLISLSTLLIEALESGKILIIDEFEKNLHPLISNYLVKLFNEKTLFNKNNTQLIFATHDVTLLNEENFNRDQIWFVEKNNHGSTEVFRCSEIKGLRLNNPLDKWYLSGRLGGTAIINDAEFISEFQKNKRNVKS